MISQRGYWEQKNCKLNRVIYGHGVHHSYSEPLLEIQGWLYILPSEENIYWRNSWPASQWLHLVVQSWHPLWDQMGCQTHSPQELKVASWWNKPAHLCDKPCMEPPRSKCEQPDKPLGPEGPSFRVTLLCSCLSVIGNILQFVSPFSFFSDM